MIHFVKGNLFDSPAQALVNTVNTVGVMGKGIALQFKEAFPNNFITYRKACKEKKLNVGELLVTSERSILGDEKIIINFPTKTHWRLPSEYSYIHTGLSALRQEIIEGKIGSVALPPLGTNNGGLDWIRVKDMIMDALADLDCDVYVYEPSDEIRERLRKERVRLTPARSMLIVLLADMIRNGEFISVFAAEKLVYFLQKFGATPYFKIDFKPYIYGPYSGGKISHVLYHLNGSYIKGMTGMSNHPFEFIWLLDNAEEEAIHYLKNLEDQLPLIICEKTKSFLRGHYSNLNLEILSTIDYILCNSEYTDILRNYNDNWILEYTLSEIKKMSSRKEQIFKPEFVKKSISRLRVGNIPKEAFLRKH